jgi:hypothetical protein
MKHEGFSGMVAARIQADWKSPSSEYSLRASLCSSWMAHTVAPVKSVVACDGRWGDQMGPSIGKLWIPAFTGITDKAQKSLRNLLTALTS